VQNLPDPFVHPAAPVRRIDLNVPASDNRVRTKGTTVKNIFVELEGGF